MAEKLAVGVKVAEEGETGGPAVRLLILNQTTVHGWVEHLHVDLDPKEAESLSLLLLSKASQAREVRDVVPGSEEDLINREEKP